MAKPLVERCIDCNAILKYSKHHFRCNRCWLKNKEKICLQNQDITIKLKPIKKIR